jgi:hypothetical protein
MIAQIVGDGLEDESHAYRAGINESETLVTQVFRTAVFGNHGFGIFSPLSSFACRLLKHLL